MPDTDLIDAAKIKDPQTYESLLKQDSGYSLAILDEVKIERLKIIASERRFGVLGAVLKSLCPSKAFADFTNIPEILAGFGVAFAVGVTSALSIPAAIIAGIGLYFLSKANYKKLMAEQNIEDDSLNTTILLAKIKRIQNLPAEIPPEEREELIKQLHNLLEEMQAITIKTIVQKEDSAFKRFLWNLAGYIGIKSLIKPKSSGLIKIRPINAKKNNQDFLTKKDKKYAIRSMIGDIFCTNAGFFALADLIISMAEVSNGLTFIGIALTTVVLSITSTYYYVKNVPHLFKDLVEQRREQSDNQQKMLKEAKNFINNHQKLSVIQNRLRLSEEEQAAVQDKLKTITLVNSKNRDNKIKKYEGYTNLGEEKTPFHSAVQSGDRHWFNYLMRTPNIEIPDKTATLGPNKKTLLHLAVEKGHLILLEKMLGTGISEKMRENKQFWNKEETFQLKNDRYKALHSQTKEMLLIETEDTGELPLHYAAKLPDPAIYELLLSPKLLVNYSKKQLDKALELRNQQIKSQKNKAGIMAILTSICPMNSLSEIIKTLTFISLTLSSLAAGLLVFGLSLLIFATVCTANYYKGQRERGLLDGLEEVSTNLAYASILQKDLATSKALTEEQQEFIKKIRQEPRLVNKGNNTKPSDFLSYKDKAMIYGSTLGSFLCSFAGILSLGELVISLSSPIGWIEMLVGSISLALLFSGIYYYNSTHDFKIVTDLAQKMYKKQEELEKIVFNEELNPPVSDAKQDQLTPPPSPSISLFKKPQSEDGGEAAGLLAHRRQAMGL